jgi:hypothetical protein
MTLTNLAIGLGAWTLLSVVLGLGIGKWLRRGGELNDPSRAAMSSLGDRA